MPSFSNPDSEQHRYAQYSECVNGTEVSRFVGLDESSYSYKLGKLKAHLQAGTIKNLCVRWGIRYVVFRETGTGWVRHLRLTEDNRRELLKKLEGDQRRMAIGAYEVRYADSIPEDFREQGAAVLTPKPPAKYPGTF